MKKIQNGLRFETTAPGTYDVYGATTGKKLGTYTYHRQASKRGVEATGKLETSTGRVELLGDFRFAKDARIYVGQVILGNA